MKKILFLVTTEYHYLVASSLIFETYNPENGFDVTIIQVGKFNSVRFKDLNLNLEMLNAEIIELEEDILKQQNFKEILNDLLNRDFLYFISFLEHIAYNVIISKRLKSKYKDKITIVLAPDGMKPYYYFTKKAIPSRAQNTISIYKSVIKHRIYFPYLFFTSWNYGHLDAIDELWDRLPNKVVNQYGKVVKKINFLSDSNTVSKVSKFFKFDINQELEFKDDVIFYTNNILFKQKLYDLEFKLLSDLKLELPDKKLIIKFHPMTPPNQLENFKHLADLLIAPKYPAELYIANLENSIVLGCWSTSLLLFNETCKYFWFRKAFQENGIMIEIDLTNPTDHIKEVSSASELAKELIS